MARQPESSAAAGDITHAIQFPNFDLRRSLRDNALRRRCAGAREGRPSGEKGVVTPDTRATGINDSQPAGLSSGHEHEEVDWSGAYAGMHGGTLGTPSHGDP